MSLRFRSGPYNAKKTLSSGELSPKIPRRELEAQRESSASQPEENQPRLWAGSKFFMGAHTEMVSPDEI